MNATEPVTVYTLTDPVEAALVKNYFREEGIACLLSGYEQASAAGLPGTTIDIQVAPRDALRAQELLVSHERAREQRMQMETESELAD